jgi:hypothetical protein
MPATATRYNSTYISHLEETLSQDDLEAPHLTYSFCNLQPRTLLSKSY